MNFETGRNNCYTVIPEDVLSENKGCINPHGLFASEIYNRDGETVIRLSERSKGEEWKDTRIYGNVDIIPGERGTVAGKGELKAVRVSASILEGNGEKVSGTDDTQVKSFRYNTLNDRIELETVNRNDPESERIFSIEADIFSQDTVIDKFGFDVHNDNVLVLRDSRGREFYTSLAKYVYTGETYIQTASCTPFGHLRFNYNRDGMNPLNVDISEAILNLDRSVTHGFMKNESLVLVRRNDTPVVINMSELIAGIKCSPDTKMADICWSGNTLCFKQTDGREWDIGFGNLVDAIIDETLPGEITGGTVESDNTIILFRRDRKDLKIGSVKCSDTRLQSAVWKANPNFPKDARQIVLRLGNSDGTNVDIRFEELINRLDFKDTHIVEGRIIREHGRNSGNSFIQLTNNFGDRLRIDGLVNSDTKIVSGHYDSHTDKKKRIVFEQNDGSKVAVDVTPLVDDCIRRNDRYLKNVQWTGSDVLAFEVEGNGTLYASFAKFRNVDTSLKKVEFDGDSGVLSLVDAQGKFFNVPVFRKTDFKSISAVDIIDETLCIRELNGKLFTKKIPFKYPVSGRYTAGENHENSKSPSITFFNNDSTEFTVRDVANTYPVSLSLDEDTLRLSLNDSRNFAVKFSPLVNYCIDSSRLYDGVYNPDTGTLTLYYEQEEVSPVVVEGLPVNTSITDTATPADGWEGTVNYHISGKSIMLDLNITAASADAPQRLCTLPVSLPFQVVRNVWGKVLGSSVNIPVSVSMEGEISFTGVLPDSVHDGFTLLYSSIN
jgi:hypothetical protein